MKAFRRWWHRRDAVAYERMARLAMHKHRRHQSLANAHADNYTYYLSRAREAHKKHESLVIDKVGGRINALPESIAVESTSEGDSAFRWHD